MALRMRGFEPINTPFKPKGGIHIDHSSLIIQRGATIQLRTYLKHYIMPETHELESHYFHSLISCGFEVEVGEGPV